VARTGELRVEITVDTRKLWLAFYRFTRWAKQPSDPNPMPPRFHLFGAPQRRRKDD
jgi:hypothetical protein